VPKVKAERQVSIVTDPKGSVTLAPPLAAADLTTVPGALPLDLVVTKSIGRALGVSTAKLESGHNSGFGNGVGAGNALYIGTAVPKLTEFEI
jgi:hypothetical protein